MCSGAEGELTFPCCFTRLFRAFLIFLSISTISRITLFTQLAPFALFCDLDVTPSFDLMAAVVRGRDKNGKWSARAHLKR
jgi:hypothetical protein